MFTLKEKLAKGETLYSGWLNTGSVFAAEIMGQSGLDCVTVDMQHGLISEENALHMLQAITATPAVPMARCSWNEPHLIMRLLDFGALAMICPMVNTAEEAKAFVEACRYAPLGTRSYGPTRPAIIYGTDYFEQANQGILTLAMIETKQALDNLEAIVATPQLDGVFIGPSDLGVELLGYPVKDDPPPQIEAEIKRIIAAANEQGKFAGIFCFTPEGAALRRQQGCRFIAAANESIHLRTSVERFLQHLR